METNRYIGCLSSISFMGVENFQGKERNQTGMSKYIADQRNSSKERMDQLLGLFGSLTRLIEEYGRYRGTGAVWACYTNTSKTSKLNSSLLERSCTEDG